MPATDTIKEFVDVKRCAECGSRFRADAAFCPFDGAGLVTSTWDPSADRLLGTVIDRRYEVVAPLGEGGMGTVYKVRHVTLDRLFALKVLRAELASDAQLAARFVQEARATAAIKHPSVVAITDFGALPDGAPYFVMELLQGETLATRLRARGPLAPFEAALVARAIADGLEASHAVGVIHRDLKPENVFLVGRSLGRAPEADIRIVDFGAAKIVGKTNKLTRPGVVFGTPYYMAPEQASGERVDARTDVYALGVVLYEMVTGTVPFGADTYMGVLTKHLFEVPQSPAMRTRMDLGELEPIIMKALAKEPAKRFDSAGELALALARLTAKAVDVVRSRPGAGRTLVLQTVDTADHIERSIRNLEAKERERRQRLVAIVLTTAAFVACLAVSAFGILRGRSTSAPEPPAPVSTVSIAAPPSPSATVVPPPVETAELSEPTPTAEPSSAPSALASSTSAVEPTPKPFKGPVGPAVTPKDPKPAASPARRADEFSDPWAPRAQ
ncbi:serine/threonine protein kinase [Labilithrix luteola]|uniref:non-specific serine/threonine protein kinase n=1 Tax=Labilithrix luteola TaxID=1391654 RepID=A0A0K1QCC5_9BACT|nr:serine/threonine-protein kinase [Labilithrix luteola]AKV03085.1 serine/threonine protein kinase [Labilithrix luteola]